MPLRSLKYGAFSVASRNEELPGFSLPTEAPKYVELDKFRVELTTVSIAMLESIGKAAECAQRDCANMRVLTYSDLL